MAFPATPTDGQTYTTSEGFQYVYVLAKTAWEFVKSTAVSGFTKHAPAESRSPSNVDSSNSGFSVGSVWVDNSTKQTFTCVASTPGAARWVTGGAILGLAFPTTSTTGDTFLNLTTGIAYIWNGTAWIDISASGASIVNNFAGTAAPAVTNDTTQGYTIGSTWIDLVAGAVYIAADVTAGAAVWVAVSGGFDLVAVDPVAPTVGDVWYNTTTNLYKTFDGITKVFTVV